MRLISYFVVFAIGILVLYALFLLFNKSSKNTDSANVDNDTDEELDIFRDLNKW